MSEEIFVQSPTRVDLCGGTLDLWPLYAFVEDAITINLAIDIYTSCRLKLRDDQKIILRSKDLNLAESFSSLKELLQSQDERLILMQSLLKFARPTTGLELETASESPIGGGLGGSSSLTVSILKAFIEARIIPGFDSTEAFAKVASNIEAHLLKTPTGTQDYVPAIRGGLNFIRYDFKGMNIETQPVPSALTRRLTLVYTGRSHHSGINNFEVLQRAVGKDENVLKALQDLRIVSQEMAPILAREVDVGKMQGLLSRELDARLALAESFTSPEIRALQKIVSKIQGAQIKICGAGGGGCVMVWSDEFDKAQIAASCTDLGLQVLPFQPVGPVL